MNLYEFVVQIGKAASLAAEGDFGYGMPTTWLVSGYNEEDAQLELMDKVLSHQDDRLKVISIKDLKIQSKAFVRVSL